MDKIDVQRVERDFENEGGSGIKRRADYWDFLNRGNGLEHEFGKRVHRKVFGVQASSKSGISNEGGEWFDIPITFENEFGGDNSSLKGGRKNKVVAKKNKKIHTKLKPPSLTTKKEAAEPIEKTVKDKVPKDISSISNLVSGVILEAVHPVELGRREQ
ncbi:hypothetical protein G4B88_010475 [Cannabis sativa]|uniref:Uncharacterized protein n=1 Tax=Cannabis sativa TaxID=3483 RepID=A0A7J6I657_CANSA|nr:hypothetical protein G4B88_010475 [Cannabis sativa]